MQSSACEPQPRQSQLRQLQRSELQRPALQDPHVLHAPAPQTSILAAPTHAHFLPRSPAPHHAGGPPAPPVPQYSPFPPLDATAVNPSTFGYPFPPPGLNIAPAPVLAPSPGSAAWSYVYTHKSQLWPATSQQPPQLPRLTSTMAIPLRSYVSQEVAEVRPAMAQAQDRDSASIPSQSHDSEPEPAPASSTSIRPEPREKKHACWMCHKSFDRPSTLRKHLLVHTGEKAFACETCGRRFGVLSNLNRHAKRCAERPVNAPREPSTESPDTSAIASAVGSAAAPTEVSISVEAGPSGAGPSGAGPSSAGPSIIVASGPSAALPPSRKRKSPMSGPEGSSGGGTPQSKPKRGRRAPSPSRWVPESLRAFDLTPLSKSTPVPLPPVRPIVDHAHIVVEERDSFDENMSAAPYHPRGWKGKLPGPALMGKDLANTGREAILVF